MLAGTWAGATCDLNGDITSLDLHQEVSDQDYMSLGGVFLASGLCPGQQTEQEQQSHPRKLQMSTAGGLKPAGLLLFAMIASLPQKAVQHSAGGMRQKQLHSSPGGLLRVIRSQSGAPQAA